MKLYKKLISSVLAGALMFTFVFSGTATVFGAKPDGTEVQYGTMPNEGIDTVAEDAFIAVGGWNETLYAEWEDPNPKGATVSYSGTMSGTLSGDDLNLIRTYEGHGRVDIPGLKAGTYTLSVKTSDGKTLTAEGITVEEHDRSGYAHDGYDRGVGAYKNDGTLKDNAVVVYVTNDNKNTVTVTAGGSTSAAGIGNILNSRGKHDGANGSLLKNLADANIPLDIRIVGSVEAPDGLTVYNSTENGGSVGDNGFMARMIDGKDITIEGIGPDAEIKGWGLHFVFNSPGYGESFEVRNIKFNGAPEDAVGMEGQYTGKNNDTALAVKRCWVHHCSFFPPKLSSGQYTDSDKSEGDGACDFKRGLYFTNSYCYYEHYHKTNLVGSSDKPTESLQYHLTYHHNYYKDCESRGPLARQADIHMYNNVVENQLSYAQNTRANAYIFSEYNYFYHSKDSQRVDGGAIKSFNDSFSGCTGVIDGKKVTDRNEPVKSGNAYESFELDTSNYAGRGEYKLQTDISEALKTVKSEAGPMKADLNEDVNTSVVGSRQPTASITLPFDKDLNSSTVTPKKDNNIDNAIVYAAKADASSITIGGDSVGKEIVFFVNKDFDITITNAADSMNPTVLMNESGVEYLTGSGTKSNLPAGTYIIESGTYDVGSNKYKEAKLSHIKITEYDPNGTTVAEPTTQATTEVVPGESAQTTTQRDYEEDTEETTTAYVDPSGAASMGRYEIGRNATGGDFNVTKNEETYGNIQFFCRSIESSGGAKLRTDNSISFTLDKKAKLTIENDGKGIIVATSDYKKEIANSKDTALTVELEPGSYVITGANSNSNSLITAIVLEALESPDTPPSPSPVSNRGDVDNDGTITSNDAAAVYVIIGNNGTVPEGKNWILERAETDGVDGINAGDAEEIMKKVLKASYVFPADKTA